MALKLRLIGALLAGLCVAACGGGGGDGDDTAGDEGEGGTASASLTRADTYGEFIRNIQAKFPGVVDDNFGDLPERPKAIDYDHAVTDFPTALAILDGNANPMVGTWVTSASLEWPVKNGKVQAVENGTGRNRMAWHDIDLRNGATANGSAQAFYGVLDGYTVSGTIRNIVPVVVLVEVIVKDASGTDQYRALKIFRGAFSNYARIDDGTTLGREGPSARPAESLYDGRYKVVVLECFISGTACHSGLVVFDYQLFMEREGTF